MGIPQDGGTLLSSVALARRVEEAEIEFCAATARAAAAEAFASLEAAGGRAVYGVGGSPMNKVLGLGLGVAATDRDLDGIEAFYGSRGAPVQIEVCPLAVADLPARLIRRGYLLQAFENVLARPVPSSPLAAAGGDPRVTVTASREDDEVWLRVVSEGFSHPETAAGEETSYPAGVPPIDEVMRQFFHPAVARYIGWTGGEPAGGGAAFASGGALGIFGTSTRPAYRRRGVQRALVVRALNDGVGRASLAFATTEPGSTSQRTFERLGFRVLYTRAIFGRG